MSSNILAAKAEAQHALHHSKSTIALQRQGLSTREDDDESTDSQIEEDDGFGTDLPTDPPRTRAHRTVHTRPLRNNPQQIPLNDDDELKAFGKATPGRFDSGLFDTPKQYDLGKELRKKMNEQGEGQGYPHGYSTYGRHTSAPGRMEPPVRDSIEPSQQTQDLTQGRKEEPARRGRNPRTPHTVESAVTEMAVPRRERERERVHPELEPEMPATEAEGDGINFRPFMNQSLRDEAEKHDYMHAYIIPDVEALKTAVKDRANEVFTITNFMMKKYHTNRSKLTDALREANDLKDQIDSLTDENRDLQDGKLTIQQDLEDAEKEIDAFETANIHFLTALQDEKQKNTVLTEELRVLRAAPTRRQARVTVTPAPGGGLAGFQQQLAAQNARAGQSLAPTANTNADGSDRRQKMSDPDKFNGISPDYRRWKGQMIIKIENDYGLDPIPKKVWDYVKSRTDLDAYDTLDINTEPGQETWTSVEDMWEELDNSFGVRIGAVKEQAMAELAALSQGTDSFTVFSHKHKSLSLKAKRDMNAGELWSKLNYKYQTELKRDRHLSYNEFIRVGKESETAFNLIKVNNPPKQSNSSGSGNASNPRAPKTTPVGTGANSKQPVRVVPMKYKRDKLSSDDFAKLRQKLIAEGKCIRCQEKGHQSGDAACILNIETKGQYKYGNVQRDTPIAEFLRLSAMTSEPTAGYRVEDAEHQLLLTNGEQGNALPRA